MPRKRKAIKSALQKKGFTLETCQHHDRYKYYIDGKFTGVHTHISRGSGYKDYSDSLLGRMKKQLKLNSKEELLDLIDCPMEEKDYRNVLRENGIL